MPVNVSVTFVNHALLDFLSSRRVIARLLSTFLCCALVVIRPFSKFGGQSAFLAITLKELAFNVQETLPQQFEMTILNLASGLLGIWLSTLAAYVSTLAFKNGQTAVARLVPALFLAIICFCAGWAKSRLPRLTLPSRIICFIAIWLLTTDPGETQPIWRQPSHFLWITLTSAVAAFVPSLLLLRWSSTQLACDVAVCFSKLQSCLSHHMGEAFEEISPTVLSDDAHKELLRRSVSLDVVYQQAAFELRFGRVSVKALKPFIGTIEHLRRELSWGMSFPQHDSTSPAVNDVIKSFYEPALELGCAILDSMSTIEKTILSCFNQSLSREDARIHAEKTFAVKGRLSSALSAARAKLKIVCDTTDFGLQSPGRDMDIPLKVFDMCSFMISLLQMAQDVRGALNDTQNILVSHSTSNVRLWYPRFTLAWLGVTPSTMLLEERGVMDHELQEHDAFTQEARQGLAEQSIPSTPPKKTKKAPPISVMWRLVRQHIWNSPRTLSVRLLISRFLKSVEHSPHLRHALKNACGISILGIPAFLPITSAGYNWFKTYYGQWMLVSFLWVLETSTGATWRVAYLRISGTVIGAIYAFVTAYISRRNAYALVALVTLADVAISYVVIRTTIPSLGIVASVTLPPIMFPPYFIEVNRSPIMLAVLRGAMIAAGIIAALLVTSFIFPRHCRVLFLNSTCRTISLFSQLYMGLSRDLLDSRTHPTSTKHKSIELEVQIRHLIHRLSFSPPPNTEPDSIVETSILVVTMDDELSLVPKPMRCYRQLVAILQRLLDLLTGIRRIRENIPRRETVELVIPQRRELMSCVCLSFFACEHAFRSRQSLPQFLPSARDALRTLEKDVEDCISVAQKETSESLGLAIVYAFAEINILRDLVQTIEELLELTRQLFGTSSWYSGPVLEPGVDEETGTEMDH